MRDKLRSFSFLVLAYNHEKYIIEHLESIKFLVVNYGCNIKVDLIISDDASKDKTVEYIDNWIELNNSTFNNIVRLYNDKNIGTCACVLNLLDMVNTDACKLTAGDDVYSYEDIFSAVIAENGVSIISGIPLHIYDSCLSKNKWEIFNIISTQEVYKQQPILNRFKFLSVHNAPNIIYALPYLKNEKVLQSLKKFDVVEDWPLQLSISSTFESTDFSQLNKVLVYYRRTVGSAYIVANQRFLNDKISIYNKLVENEVGFFKKLLMKNRRFLFVRKSALLNKVINLSFYMYVIQVVVRLLKVRKSYLKLNINMIAHCEHYNKIKECAREYYK